MPRLRTTLAEHHHSETRLTWTMLAPGAVLAVTVFLIGLVSALERGQVPPVSLPLEDRRYAVVVVYGQAPHAPGQAEGPHLWPLVGMGIVLTAVGLACAVAAIGVKRGRSRRRRAAESGQ